MEFRKEFYIDGSCNNRKTGKLSRIGGIGIVEVTDDELICQSFGDYKKTSSARMEVTALFICLRQIIQQDCRVIIYCDNQYVVNGVENGWFMGWVTSWVLNGIERPNIDIWGLIWEEINKLKTINTTIELRWIKGHSGNLYNELADKYANIGRTGKRVKEIHKKT